MITHKMDNILTLSSSSIEHDGLIVVVDKWSKWLSIRMIQETKFFWGDKITKQNVHHQNNI